MLVNVMVAKSVHMITIAQGDMPEKSPAAFFAECLNQKNKWFFVCPVPGCMSHLIQIFLTATASCSTAPSSLSIICTSVVHTMRK